jgi:very-short-patch-repair endonuclease
MAAVLACGEGALLSHQSGMALHGIPVPAPFKIHVSVTGFARRHPGVQVHRVRWLADADRSKVDGLPVTTVGRTLLDFAEVAPLAQLRRALAEAVRLRKVDVNGIWELCRRSPGRRGLRPLGAVLSEFSPPPRIRSKLERHFKRLWEQTGLDEPLFNATVAGFEVDVLWAEQRLIVELDSYKYHHIPGDFEADRARDAKLMLLGYRVLRITDRQLNEDPGGVIATIRALLEGGANLRPGDGPAEGRLWRGASW